MESEDLQSEVEAIEAIYPDHLKCLGPYIYQLKVPQHESISIQMSFPESYPGEKPHIIQVTIDKADKNNYDGNYLQDLFQEVLDSIYTEDMVCIFDFLTEIDAVLYVEEEKQGQEEQVSQETVPRKDFATETERTQDPIGELKQVELSGKGKKVTQPSAIHPLEGWIVSDPITDRKSTFQAFAKEVHSVEQAENALALLKQDRKIMRSAHDMMAYRIQDGDIKYQDYDDDGESAAGGRMLHLLTIMDAQNIIVVVSRWFGGIHLGPDRFKHINSTTRDAVIKSGLGREDKSNSKHNKKK